MPVYYFIQSRSCRGGGWGYVPVHSEGAAPILAKEIGDEPGVDALESAPRVLVVSVPRTRAASGWNPMLRIRTFSPDPNRTLLTRFFFSF